MDLQLSGRFAVVTGASRGIGLATARRLSEEGVHVLGVSRNPGPELSQVAARVVAADLATPEGAQQLSEAVAQWASSGVDILVNNAGGFPPGTDEAGYLGGFAGIDDVAWQATLDLNLLSAVRVTRALLGGLLSRHGVVVNVSSIGARAAYAPIDYGVAKAGLTNFTQGLAEEFGPQGLRAVTVTPGPTRTANWTDPEGPAGHLARSHGLDQEALLAALPAQMRLATGRLAEPEETAATIAFLVSSLAGSITGSDVRVDGGAIKTV